MSLFCPSCNGQKLWKDGLRQSRGGYTQRYVCRECGYRFSETSCDDSNPSEHIQKIQRQILNRNVTLPYSRQVCVSEAEGMINLATVETRTQEKTAGVTAPDPATIKGIIIQFVFWLEKKGDTNSPYPDIIKRLARRGANLLDPESVKEVIAKAKIKNGTKVLEVYAYDALAKMLNIQWERPHYVQEEHLPFIPEEGELDQLIAACRSKRMAAFLQTLKETFADPSEILRVRWIDLSGNIITINFPVKGHYPGQMQISDKLLAMINNVPRTSERIFPTTYDSVYPMFSRLRKRVATTLQNPRIKAISFNTFRHWGATMTYHFTRDILLVKKLLRHKRIENTMKYTKLIQFKQDDFEVATATTIEEDQELLKVSFEYVTESNGIKLYRRPKAFARLQRDN